MNPTAVPAHEYVTLVEILELTRPFEEFEAAVTAAISRLEADGIRELVSAQFYTQPGSKEIGVVITFSDRTRIIDHMTMISQWEEFQRFAAMVRLVDMRVYGRLSPEAEAWISQFGGVSRRFEQHVAGFVR